MYLAHYNLKVKPFQISPDPAFLWLGETHKEALAVLKYGVIDNSGFLLLIGDVGTGKTTLINGLLESLDENAIVATVRDPGLDVLDFYNFLADSFKMNKRFTTKGDFLVHFIHFLHKANNSGNKVLLIIDEAQRLSHEMLEEIRLLSNIEKQNEKLLNIFLVGQNEFNDTLAETRNRSLLQRITARYDIGPLKKNDVKAYIQFRLKIAGNTKTIFNAGAIREVISFSECYPRRINVICDRALLTGFVKEKDKIDAAIVKECAKELTLSNLSPKKGKNSRTSALPASLGRREAAFICLLLLLALAAGYYFFVHKSGNNLPAATVSKANIAAIDNGLSAKADSAPLLSHDEGLSSEVVTVESGMDKGAPAAATDIRDKEKEQPHTGDVKRFPEAYPDDKLTINIAKDSDELVPGSYKLMNRFIRRISLYPDAEIIIKGYTDSTGSQGYNKLLSRFRANNVKGYFVGHGIASSRISVSGMGPANPVASNATPEGRAKNRRIEIELIHP